MFTYYTISLQKQQLKKVYNNNIMIICFNKKIKSFSKENLNSNYIQSLMPGLTDIKDKKCPYCKQKNALIRYGHYSRHILIIDASNNLNDFNVSVQRVF